MNEIKELMKNGNLSFFGYSYKFLPSESMNNKNKSIFFMKKNQKIKLLDKRDIFLYSGYRDTPWDTKDIVFFDQNATKSLCAGFPTKSKFVLVSLKYPRYYIFIILGLLRRLKTGTIKIEGFLNLNNGNLLSPWLVLRCKKQETNSLSLSQAIGVSEFIHFLARNNIRYVVPRFYENLPNLEAEDADLDIIVDKDDFIKVKNFLSANPGSIPIDVYTSNGNDYHGMSYIPPVKATQVLNNAVIGPGGALIPNKQDAIDLLVYHILYHKGHLSRIPSIHNQYNSADENNNKYLRVIRPLCDSLEYEVGSTLEEMDLYMASAGWRPALDTLNKIAAWNSWVRDTLSTTIVELVPLYAFILKEGVKSNNNEELIKNGLLKEGFMVLDERELDSAVKHKAITGLRGGIWNDSLENDAEINNFYPYKILITWDRLGRPISEIAFAKQRVRALVDLKKPSLIHSSDNYSESLDYIEICMPDQFLFYKNTEEVLKKFSVHSLNKKTIFSHYGYYFSLLKTTIHNLALRIVSH